jgi:hypothetical protein
MQGRAESCTLKQVDMRLVQRAPNCTPQQPPPSDLPVSWLGCNHRLWPHPLVKLFTGQQTQ